MVTHDHELAARAGDLVREADGVRAGLKARLIIPSPPPKDVAERAIGLEPRESHGSTVGLVERGRVEAPTVLRRQRHHVLVAGKPRDAVTRPRRVQMRITGRWLDATATNTGTVSRGLGDRHRSGTRLTTDRVDLIGRCHSGRGCDRQARRHHDPRTRPPNTNPSCESSPVPGWRGSSAAQWFCPGGDRARRHRGPRRRGARVARGRGRRTHRDEALRARDRVPRAAPSADRRRLAPRTAARPAAPGAAPG